MTPSSPSPDLQFQLEINDRILRLESQLTIEPLPQAKPKHSIFLALFYKSFATARAIRLLCDHNLYGDAFALLRVLVEGVINAIYVLKSDDQIAQDYLDYPRFQAWHQFEQICKAAPQLADYVPQQGQEDMRADFEQVRSRYEKNRNGDWTKDNIFERAKLINNQGFPSLINVVWKDGSAFVHSTARSIQGRLATDGAKKTNDPTKEEIATVVYYTNMCLFSLLLFLEMMSGNKGTELWKGTFDKWRESF
jgi:hypothetical protein